MSNIVELPRRRGGRGRGKEQKTNNKNLRVSARKKKSNIFGKEGAAKYCRCAILNHNKMSKTDSSA